MHLLGSRAVCVPLDVLSFGVLDLNSFSDENIAYISVGL